MKIAALPSVDDSDVIRKDFPDVDVESSCLEVAFLIDELAANVEASFPVLAYLLGFFLLVEVKAFKELSPGLTELGQLEQELLRIKELSSLSTTAKSRCHLA